MKETFNIKNKDWKTKQKCFLCMATPCRLHPQALNRSVLENTKVCWRIQRELNHILCYIRAAGFAYVGLKAHLTDSERISCVWTLCGSPPPSPSFLTLASCPLLLCFEAVVSTLCPHMISGVGLVPGALSAYPVSHSSRKLTLPLPDPSVASRCSGWAGTACPPPPSLC